MTNEELISNFSHVENVDLDTLSVLYSVYPLFKWALIAFLVIYTIVAVVVIKQISLMINTVNGPSDKYLYYIAYVHFGIALAVLMFTLILL